MRLSNAIMSRAGACCGSMRFLAGLFIVFCLCPARAEGQAFTLVPSVTVREEANDNILLSQSDPKQEYITSLIPGFLLHYETPFWLWDAVYSRDFRHYERHTVADDAADTLTLRSRTEVAKNFFFVEISDDLARTSLDVTRDFTAQSQVVNQSERNIFTVNPYVVLTSSPKMYSVLGHSYTNTTFSDDAGIDRTDDITYLQTRSEISSRLTMTAGIRYRQNRNIVQDFDQVDVFAGPGYAYAENCFISLMAGNTWFEAGPKKETSGTFFDVGIVHRYSTDNRLTQPYGDLVIRHWFPAFTLNLQAGVQFIEEPGRVLSRQDQYGASVTKETLRAYFNLSAAQREYIDLDSKELLAKVEETQGTFRYRITQRTTGTVGAGFQHSEDRAVQSITRTELYTARLEYQLSARATLAGEYRYIESSSPQTALNNYRNNRQIVELRMTF